MAKFGYMKAKWYEEEFVIYVAPVGKKEAGS